MMAIEDRSDSGSEKGMIDDGELGNKTEDGLDGYNGDNEKTPEGKKKDEINSEASEDEQKNRFYDAPHAGHKSSRDSRESA